MAPHRSNPSRQLVILTGLSGSGKGSVLRTFEDLGFYCVDNLPVSFIPSFAEMYMGGGGEFERAVLLVDAREGEQLKRLPEIYRRLRREYPATLLFLEASSQALARRFSETRRPHPGGADLSIAEGIRLERKQMAAIRALADVVIDTTKFTVHDLRQFIFRRFQKAGQKSLLVSVMSFGFRFGLPGDADLVFDVRFLPNPHFILKLRPYSGKNAKVARYIRSFKQTGEFLRRIEGLLAYLIPHYIREGKSYLTIAFGCTGGRHRSVMLAEAVGKALSKRGYTVKVEHRDLERSVS
ncbi:MAG TPA: RNase adapter RapZ [Candidatus Acidoferrales bacterium]|nr:RNase adapter RapZ [Candidatus Acidoferrales bacterium]